MRTTKLIFVEGLPGLGKTTTASSMASRLSSAGYPVNLLLENQPGHPLNVGGDLHPAGNTPGKAFFQLYSPHSFIQESLQRWERFISTAVQGEAIHVLDSYPFQNSVRVLLQMDAANKTIVEYVNQVETMVKPLQPVLIYFNQSDSSQVLNQMQAISALRGQEWTNYVIDLVTRCPYAEARNMTGFAGVLSFVRAYKDLLDTLISESHLPRISLENCHSHWDDCYKQITAFLELSV